MAEAMDVESPLEDLFAKNFVDTQDLFVGHYFVKTNVVDTESYRLHVANKVQHEYSFDDTAAGALKSTTKSAASSSSALALIAPRTDADGDDVDELPTATAAATTTPSSSSSSSSSSSMALANISTAPPTTSALISIGREELQPPRWHAPWKLMRVISGSLGWVRCAAVDPSNEWFATGSSDNTIVVCHSTCRQTCPLLAWLVG
jgi:pleiotropic regulator 1